MFKKMQIKKADSLAAWKKLTSGRRKFVLVALGIGLAMLIGWWLLGKNQAEESSWQTAQVERGMIISSVSASGQVLSVNVMSANTQASGIVSEVFVKDGDFVHKGDKILAIDLDFQGEQKYSQAWSSYLAAKNSLESARASQYTLQAEMLNKWESFKSLAESETYEDPNSDNRTLPEFINSQNEWLSAEIKYKTQQQVISQAQSGISSAWLSYVQSSSVITAPMDGTITSLMYAPGMSIGTLDTGSSTSNQKVATIKTEGMPIVSVNLSEIDVSQVAIGQKVTVILDSIAGKTFTGSVAGVDRIGQSTSGVTQYPAIIRLDSSSAEILPNMTVTANIVIERKDDVLVVPSGSVQTQGGESLVTVLEGERTQAVPVVTGLVSDTQTEIVSGLSEGDTVVTGTTLQQTSQEGESPFGSSGMGIMRMAH
jgi:multidrug efflux pump subunit AcrA (membrane-fusion protein)